jgi:hypothetical protein
VRLRRVSPDLLVLAAILAAASVTRFTWLDLMEFKGDEANACRLALHVLGYAEPGVGRFFPTAGLNSSVSVPNPPLFVYLVAIPLAIVRSPLAAAAFVAAINVLAVWLTYIAGKRLFSRFVGLASASMLALSPWGIVFSRKIWAQDLLPLFTTLFLLQLHALLVAHRPRAAFWLIVISAAALQVHFSAFVLVPLVILALVLARRQLDWRWVAGGAAVAVLLYAPYLAYHTGDILHAARHHTTHVGPSLLARLQASGRNVLGLVGGGNMGYLIGKSSAFAAALSALLGVIAPAGLILTARRGPPPRPLAIVLLVWYALPLAVLTALPIHPFMHYFIILLPLPYLGVATAFERTLGPRSSGTSFAVALALCSFAVLDARFLRTVIHDGGAPGDYGIAYRFKQEAVAFILRRSAGQPIALGTTLDFRATRELRPYRFLVWNADVNRQSPDGSPVRYLLLSRFTGEPPLLAHALREATFRHARFGPLTIVAVPAS